MAKKFRRVTFRIPEELWWKFSEKCIKHREKSRTEVVVRLLKKYLEE